MKLEPTDVREKKALRQAFLRFLAIPVLLIVLSSLLVSHNYFKVRRDSLIQEQRNTVVSAMKDYRGFLYKLVSIMYNIDIDYLEQMATSNMQADIKAVFMDAMLKYPIIDKLRILDIDGVEILRLNQGNGSPYVVAPVALQDKSMRYFYQESKALGKHQYLFSALDLNIDNGVIDIDPETGLVKPTLRISSPIEINGQRSGYLVINFLMRDKLDQIRNYPGIAGSHILMFDENGYLYNDADDSNNFGFCYDVTSEQYQRKIFNFYPEIDMAKNWVTFVYDNKLCSYMLFPDIYNFGNDYFLSESSAHTFGFLIYYDRQSVYANDLHFSYFYHLVTSWETQLLVGAGFILLYILALRLLFLFDRERFTDLFSENRYAKATLRQAIRNHEFVNYYQPIINIQDGTVLGVEALSRWKTNKQVLEPSMFIDEVLHYQLGQMLDENVFLLVRKDRKKLEALPAFKDAFISINCCQQTFSSLIKEEPTTIIRLTEEEKKYIVLELLEDIVFNQNTQNRIRELYKHNILFAIDDFGTGNSNIAFIRSFENLKVKIDRTFVPVDTTDKKECVIIEAFVKMFVDQGLRMIVEGVETYEQIQYLKKLGIQGVQGFYFSRPMTIDELIEFIQKQEYLGKLQAKRLRCSPVLQNILRVCRSSTPIKRREA